MRLRKFRVRAFRCIHDSGEIKVGDLALEETRVEKLQY